MRRLTRTIATAALVTALVLVTGCSGSDDAKEPGGDGAASLEKVSYLTSFGNFGRDSYALVAKDKGFFKQSGFDVDVKPGGGTNDVIKHVVSGAADFGVIDLTGGLLQMGQGQAKDFVAVAAIHQRTMAAIVSLEGNNITSPKDLEGKTLADTPASVVYNLFPTYAKLAGFDVNKVKWVHGDPQNLMGMLAAEKVDGIGQFVVGKPTVETVAKGKKAALLPYSDVMTDLYGNALIVSAKMAKEKPEMVRKFTEALLQGLEYSIDHPQESGEILAKNVPATNAEAAAAELELMAAFVRSAGSGAAVGTLDSQRLARAIAILQGAGAIEPGLTPEQVVDFELAPKS
ncbi:MAG TPA: ABC transporter substrate-binding protein [Micromonospora sp.]|nr:ABC transporter substrate-binding protein [Micromonospora sp.]